MVDKIQKAIDSITDPQNDAEWKEHDAALLRICQDARKALDGARASVRKLEAAANKCKKYHWGGNQVAYLQDAARKLQECVYNAEDAIEKAESDLRR